MDLIAEVPWYIHIYVYTILQHNKVISIMSFHISYKLMKELVSSVILLLCIFWTIQHLDICMVCRASCLLRMNIQRKPGDWNCKNCQHLNFSRRDYCQRCRDPRPDLQFSDGYSTGGVLTSLDIRPGDWYCSCGYHNFASRSSCFKCGTIVRDFPAGQGAAGAEGDLARGRDSAAVRAGWKAGDWICTRWSPTILISSIDECLCMHGKEQWHACMFYDEC